MDSFEKSKNSSKNSANNQKNKPLTKKSSGNEKNKPSTKKSSMIDCLQGNNLEIIVAALLLTGKLRVDAVQLFRQATLIVSLTGKYNTLDDMNNSNVNKMLKFMNENGNMTLDEMIEALKKKTGNG